MNSELIAIDFRGSPLWATQIGDDVFVAIKSICDRLGIDWRAQLKRIKRDPLLAEGVVIMDTPSPGGVQETTLLRLDLLSGWLFGIVENKVKPEFREGIRDLRREGYRVLHEHFFGKRDLPVLTERWISPQWEGFRLGTPEGVAWHNSVMAGASRASKAGGPAACAAFMREVGYPDFGRIMEGHLHNAGTFSPTDARACHARILAAEIADSDGVVVTLGEALGEPGLRLALDAVGIQPEGAGFWVANRHAFLDTLFAGTAFTGGQWRDALRLIPGAIFDKRHNNRKIDGMARRATWVPATVD